MSSSKVMTIHRSLISLFLGIGLLLPLRAQDWPTYMHDNSRSGVTTATFTLPLREQWVYTAPAAPVPAWPDPQDGFSGEFPKLRFDDAFYTVAVGDTVYFGSSVDYKVYAVDAATGQVRWTFFTNGPVRTAPTVDNGRVFAASDDGALYCLNAADGALLWQYKGMPRQRYVLGSGRMISLWPIRSGVVVDRDLVYFCAGIFPSDGVALVALNAADGSVAWRNDAAARSQDFSPQGYMLLSDTRIIAPSGRTLPRVFARETGKFLFHVERKKGMPKGHASGTYITLIDNTTYVGTQNTLQAHEVEKGMHVREWPSARRLLVTPTHYYVLKGLNPMRPDPAKRPDGITEVLAYDRAAVEQSDKRDAAALQGALKWSYRKADLDALIVAGNAVIAGGADAVYVLDALTGKELWTGAVNGRAAGLTVARGRLLVSTDSGAVHCFGSGAPRARVAQAAGEPFPVDALTPVYAQAAEAILAKMPHRKGYSLVTGSGGARLGYEIAKRSELRVHCADYDAANVQRARRALDAAGLYGTRMVVDLLPKDAPLPYSDYFANLVVHLASPGQPAPSEAELLRVLKPCGGLLMTGPLTREAAVAKPPQEALRRWGTAGTLREDVILLPSAGPWMVCTRDPLPGAGSWTHQYADPGNTASSEDRLVTTHELDVLWYGESGPGPGEVPNRHFKNVAPLSINGLVFHQALNTRTGRTYIICFDAYNGTRYWERDIPGAYRVNTSADSGNLACTAEHLYVAAGNKCHRVDIATGNISAVYDVPPAADGTANDWGYIALVDGLLIGSRRVTDNPTAPQWRVMSEALFAYDLATGALKWTFTTQIFRNNTVSISDGRLFFALQRPIEGGVLSEDEQARAQRLGEAPEGDAPTPIMRTVMALNVATGGKIWERNVNLVNTGAMTLAKNGVLVFGVVASPYGGKKDPSRRIVALSATDGALLWEKAVGNTSRLLVMGDTLIAQPAALDLRTGEPRMITDRGRTVPWRMGRMSACGAMAASSTMLFFREGWSTWVNFVTLQRARLVGMRSGCWVNVIPVNGVVVQAEASSGCTCYHSMQSTIVFKPRETAQAQ